MNLKSCVVAFVCLVQTANAFPNSLEGFLCPSNQVIKHGLNKNWKSHQRVRRTFFAEFPEVPLGTPVGVIFSWHGAGDSIEKWRSRFPIADDSSPQFPFIVITPHDVGLTPHGHPKGLSWDLFISRRGDENLEAMLFESVLGCLSQNHNIHPRRIFSAGFSAGAMVSNMLHSRYPETIKAVFSASGAWLNNVEEAAMFKFPFGLRIPMNWDPLNNQDGGTVFLTDGGIGDNYKVFGKEVLSFNKAAQAGVRFLSQNQRTVIYCSHEQGHTLHPGMTSSHAVRIFRAQETSAVIKDGNDLPHSMRSSCAVIHP